jgi:D-alanyl-D-alanine carboxypeptidase
MLKLCKCNRFFRIGLILLFVLFAGCESDKGSGPAGPPEGTALLESLCDSVVDNTPVPGMVVGLQIKNPPVHWEYATGLADLTTGSPMETDMYFRIASITKTMVNTVLFQLVDEGLISLSDTLFRYRPDIPGSDLITILMLSDMSSGIAEYSSHPRFLHMSLADPAHYWPPDTLIALGASLEPVSDPGAEWNYSNTNTLILGRIIEKLTGHSLEYELQTRIFDPHALLHTSFPASGYEMPDPHPKGYYTGALTFPRDWSEGYDISVAWAAGAVISTLSDLREYAPLLTDGLLISEKSHAFRMSHEIETDVEGAYYGPGILRWRSFYGHLGGLPGFTSLMLRDPDRDITLIILYNCQLNAYQPAQLAERIWQQIFIKDIFSL